MCASTVSSKMLATVAAAEGFHFSETLTGFKYLGNECARLSALGMDPVFAYEEAIGYLQGRDVRDKDGVGALGTFCEMAACMHDEGRTVTAWLQQLYDKLSRREVDARGHAEWVDWCTQIRLLQDEQLVLHQP